MKSWSMRRTICSASSWAVWCREKRLHVAGVNYCMVLNISMGWELPIAIWNSTIWCWTTLASLKSSISDAHASSRTPLKAVSLSLKVIYKKNHEKFSVIAQLTLCLLRCLWIWSVHCAWNIQSTDVWPEKIGYLVMWCDIYLHDDPAIPLANSKAERSFVSSVRNEPKPPATAIAETASPRIAHCHVGYYGTRPGASLKFGNYTCRFLG